DSRRYGARRRASARGEGLVGYQASTCTSLDRRVVAKVSMRCASITFHDVVPTAYGPVVAGKRNGGWASDGRPATTTAKTVPATRARARKKCRRECPMLRP